MSQLLDIATRTASRAPMQTHEEAQITTASGLQHDYRGKPGKRQVTLLSQTQWQEACSQLGAELAWTVRRANLLISDLEFGPELVGQKLQIGQTILQISAETEPCFRMDEQHQGLTQALTPHWRGGACCRVLQSGRVKKGDTVTLLAE